MSKMKKNHHQKIQNKLPKGEEKPGNQMDRFTRPKIICPPVLKQKAGSPIF
jgi:hypothetical protein